MDQRFVQGADTIAMAFEKENRRLGAMFLLAGVACTWITWYLGPRWSALSGARIVVITIGGGVLLLAGFANVISPPKTALRSRENKRRAEVLGILGIVIAGVELYFYNDIYGVW